jgi:hypothetical protein
MGTFIVQAIIMVASTAYQQSQQNKLKRQQEAARQASLGFEISKVGEAAAIPIVYGKQLIGGNQVAEKVRSSFTYNGGDVDRAFSTGFPATNVVGSKNEFLVAQYVVCQGGIESIEHVKVDGADYNKSDNKFQHIIHTNYDEGVSPLASSNGLPSTNLFTGCAHATGAFKLNRDEPNYNGIPSLEFLVKGRKVRTINSSHVLSTAYTFSTNPAYCLLDYLLGDHGRGLNVNQVDLESFYNAAQVCDTTVLTAAKATGKINGGDTTRDVPLYECNIAIDPARPLRDNIVELLETMKFAELTYSTEGQYKLSLEYPETVAEVNALVPSNLVFNDDNIIRDSFQIKFPSADERLNQVTVRFADEHKDFKDDTFTYPLTNSTEYNTFLSEDNGQPHRSEVKGRGITDIYHAQSHAEFLVKRSRDIFYVSFSVNKDGLYLEPGDFIKIDSDTVGMNGEIFRVEAVKFNDDFTVEVNAYFYSLDTLTWTSANLTAYPDPAPVFDLVVERPTSLTFTADSANASGFVSGKLDWPASDDINVSEYIVEVSSDNGSTYIELGRTQHTTIDVGGLKTDTYIFSVTARTRLGKLSERITTTAQSISGKVPDRVVVIYADGADEATNNQSYTLTTQEYVAYHVTGDETDPTLPITSNITFQRFIGQDGNEGNPNAWWDVAWEDDPQWDSSNTAFDASIDTGWFYARNALNSGEFFQFNVEQAGATVGLTDTTYNASTNHGAQSNMDYNIVFGSTTFQVYRQAIPQGSAQAYSTGDTMAMGMRDDGSGNWSVAFYQNGIIVFTEAVSTGVANARPYWVGDSGSATGEYLADIARVNIAERGVDGVIGSDGLTAIQVSIFKRSLSTPATPTTGTYDFGTLSLSTTPSGWSESFPAGTDPVYVCTVVASTTDVAVPDSSLTWTAPVLLVQDGTAGTPGTTGDRGAGWWRYEDTVNASSYYGTSTNTRVTAAFTAATGFTSPTDGDRLIVACTDIAVGFIYDYSSNTWNTAAEFIDGNLLVAGTVTAASLESTQLDAMFATIGTLKSATTGARVEISDDVIEVYDASGALRVKLGNLT